MATENNSNVMSIKYKYFLTFVVYLCYLVYASNLYITGPSLLDLQRIYKTSFNEISNVNTIRAFAYTFGALNGFAFQFINKQIGFMCCLLVIAITMALTPHLSSINMLFFNFAVNGFASGGIESSADVWIVEMWQQDCGPYVQALHFVFGIGSIITPLVVEPFLSEVKSPDETIVSSLNATNETIEAIGLTGNRFRFANNQTFNSSLIVSLDTVDDELFVSRVYIPYTFLAIIIAICGLFLGSLYFYKEYKPPTIRSAQKPNDNNNNADKQQPKKPSTLIEKLNQSFVDQLMPTRNILIMIVLCGYLMSIFLSLEWSQFNYFPSFAHFSGLHLSEKEAAIVSTGMAVAFTAGRAISIPISHFLSPKIMIYCSLGLLLVAELLFLIFSSTSVVFMWIANIVFGLGLSPIYAAIYHMVEEVTPVTNLVGVLFIFMSGLTSALTPIILGIYIESEPLILVYISLVCVIISICLIIAIHIVINKCILPQKSDTITGDNNNITDGNNRPVTPRESHL